MDTDGWVMQWSVAVLGHCEVERKGINETFSGLCPELGRSAREKQEARDSPRAGVAASVIVISFFEHAPTQPQNPESVMSTVDKFADFLKKVFRRGKKEGEKRILTAKES